MTLLQMVGDPSTALMTELGDEVKARVAKRKEDLGESGLKEKTDRIQKATEDNEVLYYVRAIPLQGVGPLPENLTQASPIQNGQSASD